MSYSSDILKFTGTAKANGRRVLRGVACEMHDLIVDSTPFDTGRARTSWNIVEGFDADLTTTPPLKLSLGRHGAVEVPPPGAEPLSKSQANEVARSYQENIPDVPAEPAITISNNLEYAPGLEDGSISKQGDHMLENTVNDFQRIVSQVAAGVKP